jgi:carboxypeptidase C (cathepsin A)
VQHLARDFYSFLVNWLSIFHDKTGLDIYIVGESYAGWLPGSTQ